MKTLECLKKFQLKEEMNNLNGGTKVQGSFSIGGSAFKYSGDMSLTNDTVTSLGVISGTSYVSDFCGTATFDGIADVGCAQRIRGTWVRV